MGNQIVMETGKLTAPNATIAMCTLVVSRIVETLAQRTPLHGEAIVIVERSHLIDTPTERTVVENLIAILTRPNSIGSIIYILHLTAATTNIANDDIVSIRSHREIAKCNTRFRCRLSCNGGVFPNDEVCHQVDVSTHIKHNRARSSLLQAPTERPLCIAILIISKRGDMIHISSTSTCCRISSMSFSSRESRSLSV